MWFGQDRKQETLNEFFRTELNAPQRERMEAACVDMWRPFTNCIEQWTRSCRIVYDKSHFLQHASKSIDELRLAEFYSKGVVHARCREGQALAEALRKRKFPLIVSRIGTHRFYRVVFGPYSNVP